MLKTWVLFLLALPMFISLPSISLVGSSPYESAAVADQDSGFIVPSNARNLEETENRGEFNLEDYHPVDPSPTTKASIKPGPIQHGSPLNPYIPKPPPPPPPPPPQPQPSPEQPQLQPSPEHPADGG